MTHCLPVSLLAKTKDMLRITVNATPQAHCHFPGAVASTGQSSDLRPSRPVVTVLIILPTKQSVTHTGDMTSNTIDTQGTWHLIP